MGGKGSGGNGRLTDAEKRAKGTYRSDRSDEVYAAKAAEKVITGPWLTSIPEPTLPLNEVGRAKYNDITKILFQGNKLTAVTCMDCEVLALHWQSVEAKIAAGKAPSTDSLKQIASITARLRIAEDAPAIANPNQKNRFAGSGFSNSRTSPITLRPHRAAGTGKL